MRKLEFEKTGLSVDVFMENEVVEKINDLIHTNPKRECGGFFIGNILEDNVTGKRVVHIHDLYYEKQYGTGASFEFGPDYGLRAKAYVMKNCEGYHIVGNVHSHAQFDPFFSHIDKAMMAQSRDDSFYMVVSPRYGTWVGIFKDFDFNYHEVNLIMADEKLGKKPFEKDEEKCNRNIESSIEKGRVAGEACTTATFRTEHNYTDLQQKEFDKRFLHSQKALEGKRLLIVGAGTLGNSLAEFAMNSGVTDITIVDKDTYAFYNKPRSSMMENESIGRLKALELARLVAEKSSFTVDVKGINADIYNLGWGFLKDFDLVMTPLDNAHARHFVDRGCKLYGVPHITCGTGTVHDDFQGNVVCLPKNSGVDLDLIWGTGYRKSLEEFRNCSDIKEETQPQVMPFSAQIAGMAMSLGIKYLLGEIEEDDVAVKYVLNAVGDGYESDSVALRNYRYRTIPSVIKSELFDVWNKDEPIPEITFGRTQPKGELWDMLEELFHEDSEYALDLEWSMNKPVAYHSSNAVARIEILPGKGVDPTFERLPEKHIYKVEATNGELHLVEITLTEE